MNLINRQYEATSILQFREYQYELIMPFIILSIKYLEQLGLKIDPSQFEIKVIDDISYFGSNHFACKIVKIKINKQFKDYFISLTIPKLIDSSFFKLNGVYYVPGFYIVDEPIVIKKSSFLLTSLFNPITLYKKENRAIILGNNIPLSRLLRLYYTELEIIDLSNKLKFEYLYEKSETSILQLANKFHCVPDKIVLKELLNNLFFDDWTKELYQKYYNIEDISLKKVFDQLLICIDNKSENSFIDLKHKRLAFTELLLAPLFKSVSIAVPNLLRGAQIFQLNIKLGDIIQHFYDKLNGFNFYDNVNGYSGLLSLKATFSNPSSSGELPSCVSSIHPSYKGKIDPISISNTNPGVNVVLIPDQKVDLKYGIFLD